MSKTGCPLQAKDVLLPWVDVTEMSLSIFIVSSTENLSVAN